MSFERSTIALGAALLCSGCGDPLVGPDFLGTVILSLNGVVRQVDDPPQPKTFDSANLSLFWVGYDSREMLRPVLEQHAEVDAGLAAFSMSLFDEPPAEALTFGDLDRSGRTSLGIALIVLYDDANLNGVLNNFEPYSQGPDTVLGASAQHLVVFAGAKLDENSDAGRLLGAIDRGYHLYTTTVDSTCRFVGAQSCEGEGALAEVFPEQASVTLSLYSDPGEVIVPSPALAASSGTQPGNIYGPR